MKQTSPLLLIIFFVFFTACSSPDNADNSLRQLNPTPKGNAYYGGIFSWNEEEFFRTLYPPAMSDAIGHRVANQIYEGLVRPNQTNLDIEPVLAQSWTVSPDGKVYTFRIRKNVYFQDDACFPNNKGRTVSAYDFKYCLDKVCTFSADNKGINFFRDRIVGAADYFKQTETAKPTAEGVKGIAATDSSTLVISINEAFPNFLYLLSMQYGFVYPHEAFDKYGADGMRLHAVGTGPFYVKRADENQTVLLLKNPNYWAKDADGNSLPYLNGIRISFVGDKMAELLNFKQNKLDLVYKLPYENTDEIVDRQGKLLGDYSQYVFQEAPTLNIQYYGFLTTSKLFSNKKLRQALNFAVDRQRLVDNTLKGAAIAAVHGRTPSCVPNYDYTKLVGYNYNPKKAQQLLAEAGYPNGKGLPEITLQINGGGKRNEQVAEAVEKMIEETLGIQIRIEKLPMAQHFENVEAGKTEFWRSGWMGDYPDPENFLNYFSSKHLPDSPNGRAYLNTVRYNNPKFDQLMAQALATSNATQRNQLYLKAEQLTLDDAVALNLFYEKDRRLLQPNVHNLPQNMLEYRNLVSTYLSPK